LIRKWFYFSKKKPCHLFSSKNINLNMLLLDLSNTYK
jgi:hypothetical protein